MRRIAVRPILHVPSSATASSDSGILIQTVTATATQAQLNRVTFDGFYTAYGLAFGSFYFYYIGVTDRHAPGRAQL